MASSLTASLESASLATGAVQPALGTVTRTAPGAKTVSNYLTGSASAQEILCQLGSSGEVS